MAKHLLFFTLLFCLFIVRTTQAQRQLPYPILFVHGFAGSSNNWAPFINYLSNQPGFYIPLNNRLDYCLNADGDQTTAQVYATQTRASDIFDYNLPLTVSDVYVINFDVCSAFGGSNRSAAVKQGYAVGLAVSRILAVTGADKVILMGHSMGGLAIREYLQTPSNWATGDGRHHIAKVVTVGTPHGGSNLGSGDINLGWIYGVFSGTDYDERSEAVRDLRTKYKTGQSGVYLFGGYEDNTVIGRGFFSNYFNLDVNSNGRTGDLVQGLNQKDISIDLAYALVIGNGYYDSFGYSDNVVTTYSQNLNNFYTINAPIFYHPFDHREVIEKAPLQEIYALDEPDQLSLAYKIDFNRTYKGLLTNQASGELWDVDRYRFTTPGRGVLTANVTTAPGAASSSRLLSTNGQILSSLGGSGTFKSFITSGGDNFLEIGGLSGNGWSTYFYNINFCPLPDDPSITTNGKTTICEGEQITLSATSGYDTYTWYKDGIRLTQTGSQITVGQTGLYTVESAKCGLTRSSGTTVGVTVNSIPSVPTIRPSIDGNGLVSSASTGNQWYLNGSPIFGATSQTLPYSMLSAGSVQLRVTTNGCANTSTTFTITSTEPAVVTKIVQVSPNPATTRLLLKTVGATPFSLQLINLLGQVVYSAQTVIHTNENQLDVSQLPRGLYFLRLTSSTQDQVLKVLLE
jgi:pimeloyl-ACP methyl ester carboxylesterase